MPHYLIKQKEIYTNKILVEADSIEEAYELAESGEGVYPPEPKAKFFRYLETVYEPFNKDNIEEISATQAENLKADYRNG